MIVLFGAILGAAIGALTAWRRKGRLADIVQYAAVHALIFALAGLFASILIDRLAT